MEMNRKTVLTGQNLGVGPPERMKSEDGEQGGVWLLPKAGDDGEREGQGREMENEEVNGPLVAEAPEKLGETQEEDEKGDETHSIIMYQAVPIVGTSSLTCRSNIGTACHIEVALL